MKLINQFVFDEKEHFAALLEREKGIDKDKILNSLGSFHKMDVKYFKDDRGNLNIKYYFDGQKVKRSELNGYYKEYINEFENETRVLFQ